MRTGLALAALGVVITAGSVMLAAPGGQGQGQPGQIGQARVFIENRGRADAVPVVLQEVMTPSPMAVQVTGTPTVTIAQTAVLQTRLARQQWEYRSLTIQPGQDAAAALSGFGSDGWETTGVQLPTSSGTALLLKRPR